MTKQRAGNDRRISVVGELSEFAVHNELGEFVDNSSSHAAKSKLCRLAGLTRLTVLVLVFVMLVGRPDRAFCDEASDAAVKTLDLFIFAGQSNMVGADADPAALPDDPSDEQVWFWWSVGDPPADVHDSTSGGRWLTLQHQPLGKPKPRDGANRQWGNFSSPDGGFGPEIGFARKRLSVGDKTGQPAFAILKVAYSGTSVEDDWDPRQSHRPGNCYGELIRQLGRSTKVAAHDGFALRPRAFFWVQGESDATPERRGWYQNRMTEMLAALREDVGVVDLPVFLALNTNFLGPDDPGVAEIVETQKRLAALDSRVDYVDTSRASVANRVHFDAAGTLDVGRWFADALASVGDE